MSTSAESPAVLAPCVLGGPTDVDNRRLILGILFPDEAWKPAASCTCGWDLSPWEVLQGFSDDPQDVTTECPDCGLRFKAVLTAKEVGPQSRWFCCSGQLTHTLRSHKDLARLSLPELIAKQPDLVATARFHHLTMKAAFAAAGLDYRGEEEFPLAEKVRLLASEIPAPVIAAHLGIEEARVRELAA